MILFVNAAFRENSRTRELVAEVLKQQKEEIYTIELGDLEIQPLDREKLQMYMEAGKKKDFSDPWFDHAKRFAAADGIIIAAPFWNYGLPAVLHTYLEAVCTQGITFDLNEEGQYVSLCHAKFLTFVSTAGGPIPKQNHSADYLKLLAKEFWNIPVVREYSADELDLIGVNAEEKLKEAVSIIKSLEN